jgi:hypothetical protein
VGKHSTAAPSELPKEIGSPSQLRVALSSDKFKLWPIFLVPLKSDWQCVPARPHLPPHDLNVMDTSAVTCKVITEADKEKH